MMSIGVDRGGVRAEVLKDINLTICEGEFVSIIGHSGCGKSNLLNLIAGLTPISAGAVADGLRQRQSRSLQGFQQNEDQERAA
jgi:ABC-type nitrate/sulfonate/bicarbonate transport system ATPase subunit